MNTINNLDISKNKRLKTIIKITIKYLTKSKTRLYLIFSGLWSGLFFAFFIVIKSQVKITPNNADIASVAMLLINSIILSIVVVVYIVDNLYKITKNIKWKKNL